MRNLSAIALVFWVFLLVPGLCGAGLLSHACASDESADCMHEEMCAQDPCSMLTIRTGPTEPARVSDFAVVVSPMAVAVVATSLQCRRRFDNPGVTSRHNIPVPPDDLPLLI